MPDAGPSRVLVVDDDEVVRQLLALHLELEGFDVVQARDGEEALEVVRALRPVVVTLDVSMPRLDGWETTARLRADPATADVRVVLVSGRVGDDDRRRGGELGVDAHLAKPFDPDELVSTVRRLAVA